MRVEKAAETWPRSQKESPEKIFAVFRIVPFAEIFLHHFPLVEIFINAGEYGEDIVGYTFGVEHIQSRDIARQAVSEIVFGGAVVYDEKIVVKIDKLLRQTLYPV